MPDTSSLVLQTIGYYEQMLLVYLEQVYTEKDTLVSLKTIKQDMGITYTTLKNKIDNLEPLGLIFTTKRDRVKVVVITEK